MNSIHKNKFSLILLLLLSLLLSCSHSHEHQDGEGHDHAEHAGHAHGEEKGHGHEVAGAHQEGEHQDGEIHLTQEQIETMNIQLGDFSQVKINDFIRATGTLGLPPNALYYVNAKANGFIKNSNKYVEGSYVKKGTIMAYLENPQFIQQQQEYLEVAASLRFDQQELARQKSLYEAQAGVEKAVQQLEAEVAQQNARLQGLAKQLGYLGIKAEQVTTDNIVERIPIYAPMSGYLTSIQMYNGMYVTPEMELMKIIDDEHLHLELDVFEKDIAQVAIGQAVSYSIPALGGQIYEGEVHVMGKEFDLANKTVRIHGHLEGKRPPFIKDLFVEAKIWLNDQTVQALPEKAIIKDGAASLIYVTSAEGESPELEFEAVRVMPSTTDQGFTGVQLIDEIPEGWKIVTAGAYYVYAQSKAGELEHSH